ncbi:hypothetical protein C1637_09985 [Chryseobacterium lactis]|uniref:Uncharacterized protein n=1 Tax=Chryseobacterium lactis TaxID=1241981 RepID=A0A3G6RLY6_CHRLC|nr:hypothetical protein [Chryseobacterium lactis]AZA82159.1 hypothetical protein EG342_09710 [Chryseobacterium lactis]AZB02540.1 hypothetical protein EG341_00565 [Chryseobacterium lactis]PNW14164.1 hypothetical protein C1637_09985 [Chryseobacterium lactis]
MYRLNNLKRNVLITPDEVIFHAATDQQIAERQILQNIIVAEERWIANAICDKFYEDFISKKNVTVTQENKADLLQKINTSFELDGLNPIKDSDLKIGMIINAIEFVDNLWYVKLWERFLWKLSAECVDMTSIVPSWLRHTSIGQQMNNPNAIGGNGASSASGGVKEINFKQASSIQDRIDPLIERMHLWICQNKENFPLYCKDCGGCGCDGELTGVDGVSHIRKTNFITNIYED